MQHLLKVEAGEVIDANLSASDLVELGELIDFEDTDKWSPQAERIEEIQSGDVTIFKSVGVGVQDAAISRAVVDAAKGYGIGTVIDNYH